MNPHQELILDFLNQSHHVDFPGYNFLDALTINVSRFFRDPLRIWSAGCSFGEEAYSVAILINEAKKKENLAVEVEIFATDIDKKAITKAQQALFPFDSIKTVK